MPKSVNNDQFRKLLLSYPRKAIDLLYRRWSEPLFKYSMKYTHNEEASKDILQETFLLVMEERSALVQEHDKPIEAYLMAVVRNKSILFYKKSAFLLDFDDERAALTLPADDAELRNLVTDLLAELQRVIPSFPLRERQCLTMCLEQNMSTKEIAATLNVTVKAVHRSLRCGTQRFRAHWLARV